MKNRKWLTYTLGTLLTLIVLAVVGGAGYRIGMMQNKSFVHPAFTGGFNGGPQAMQRNFQGNGESQRMQGNPQGNDWRQMQGNPRNQGFDNQGGNRIGDRRSGRMSFLFPFIFGVIHLVVLGLILWIVYKLVKKSGWRFTREPATSKTSNVEVEEKKASE
jgi:hypothetical protein